MQVAVLSDELGAERAQAALRMHDLDDASLQEALIAEEAAQTWDPRPAPVSPKEARQLVNSGWLEATNVHRGWAKGADARDVDVRAETAALRLAVEEATQALREAVETVHAAGAAAESAEVRPRLSLGLTGRVAFCASRYL